MASNEVVNVDEHASDAVSPHAGFRLISTAIFEQQAAVVAALQCKYIDPNTSKEVPKQLGVRVTVGNYYTVNLKEWEIPDGALIKFGADVMGDGDPWLNEYFQVDYANGLTAQFKLVGALFNTSFFLKSLS